MFAGDAKLVIRLFGGFEAIVDGQPLCRAWHNDRLLALLMLQRASPADRALLAATLWPDADEPNARFYLRRTLAALRQALGWQARRILSPRPGTLQLDLQDAYCDLKLFDDACRARESGGPGPPNREGLRRLRDAVSVYSGPLLQGWEDEWVFQERIARETLYLDALETLASRARIAGESAVAVRCLRQLLAVDPLRESAYRELMLALAATGDYAAITQTYRDLRLRLHEELQVAPSESTTALYHDLRQEARRGDSRPAAPPTQKPDRPGLLLPSPITSLIGRDEHVREVVELVSSARLVMLTGTGGVGKTRLAIAVAQEMHADFDRVCFVDLSALSDEVLVPQAVATTLGARPAAGRTYLEVVLEVLSKQKSLLVLDNCEHLPAGCASIVSSLLAACPGLHVLATSRRTIGVSGERQWRVPSLSLPDLSVFRNVGKDVRDSLLDSAAARLFVERARSAYPGFQVTAENSERIAQVCCAMDGIPFAIELAAAWTRVLPVEEVAGRLGQHLDLLIGVDRMAPARRQTLRAALDWSYGLLDEREKRLLSKLSVFRGGFTLEAAEHLCAEDEEEPNSVLLDLARLADQSLVVYEQRNGQARYRLLETTRQYAAEQLKRSGEQEELRARHGAFFLQLAETARPLLRGPDQADWLEKLETEHENMRSALAWWADEDANIGHELRLLAALQPFWSARGYLNEGLRQSMAVLSKLSAAREADPPAELRIRALNGAGLLARTQGDYARAESLMNEALTLCRSTESPTDTAVTLGNLGTVAWSYGDYARAQSLGEEALAIRRGLMDTWGIALSLGNLGILAAERGDVDGAWRLFEESLVIRRELGDRSGVALTLGNLGLVAYEQCRDDAAQQLQEEALAIRRELDDPWGTCLSLGNLGLVAWARGDFASARRYQEEALEISRKLDDTRNVALALGNLCLIALSEGDVRRAYEYESDAIELRRKLGDRQGLALSLDNFARLAEALGEMERAVRIAAAAESLRTAIGISPSPRATAEASVFTQTRLANLGQEAFARAQEEGAALTMEEAIRLAQSSAPGVVDANLSPNL